VRLKRAQRPDGSWLSKPEVDDLIALAQGHGLPLAALRSRVLALLEAEEPGPGAAP
jgi:hypothetical protein